MLYHERKARNKGFEIIVGIDEAGRGPLAGPVVAASVVLGKKRFKARIDDSKKLSPEKRSKAFVEILRTCLVSIGIVDHSKIDRVNIQKATQVAMEEAVLGLGIKPDCLLIDGRINLDLPFYKKCIIRGDSKSMSIAAASIVAKVVRDTIMSTYDGTYPEYEFRRHKGYGTLRHRSLLRNLGPCPIHRRSFKLKKEVK